LQETIQALWDPLGFFFGDHQTTPEFSESPNPGVVSVWGSRAMSYIAPPGHGGVAVFPLEQ
jgi:hypothetical protein